MKKRNLAIALTALLASASTLVAQNATSSQAPSSTEPALSLEIFLSFGAGLNDLLPSGVSDGEKINTAGINFVVSTPLVNDKGSPVSIDGFALIGFSGGSHETDYYGVGGKLREETLTLFTSEFSVGATINYEISPVATTFAGARIGLSFVNFEAEFEDYSSGYKTTESASDTAVGGIFGVGVGMQFNFNEHHGMTVGVDYTYLTARPEILGVKIEQQSYATFSIGYVYTF